MSEESIENITKSDSNFVSNFVDHHLLPDINFNGHCLIKNIYISRKVINIYILYTLGPQLRNLSTDYKLGNNLFGSVKPTKNPDLHKYKYSSYDIGLDSRSELLLPDSTKGKNVIISAADMSSSVHFDNKGKDILILREGPIQRLDNHINSRSKTSYQFYTIRKKICIKSTL